MERFDGAKAALLLGPQLVVMRRDDLGHIPWPGAVDLPGGGREGGETPEECAVREVAEELTLVLPPDRFHWRRAYGPVLPGQSRTWLLAARITAGEVGRIRLGSEGQGWWLESAEAFLARADAVTHLQDRLRDYLADTA